MARWEFVANFGFPQDFEEIAKRTSFAPGRGTVVGRVLLTGKPVQIADVEADPEYTYSKGQRLGGFRTILAVPLERERRFDYAAIGTVSNVASRLCDEAKPGQILVPPSP